MCSPYPLRQDAIENEFMYPTLKVWGDPGAFAKTWYRPSRRDRPPGCRAPWRPASRRPSNSYLPFWAGLYCVAGGRTGHL